jgi:branched-chain amino acid transport system substrate-binding protein
MRFGTLCSLAGAFAVVTLCATTPVAAQDTVKIGAILPMTGPFQSTGAEAIAAINLFLEQHGATIAGKKIEVILRDDGGTPDNAKRLAQELIVNDKAQILIGFGLTPIAMAVAPLATEAKVPMVVTVASTSVIVDRSPYIVRTIQTIPQIANVLGAWTAKNNIKSIVTVVSDYAPGHDAEQWFGKSFEQGGGKVLEKLRVPLANPDFAPFLQRASDNKPDAIFAFVPAGVGGIFAKQFVERGLNKSGIKLISMSDVMDDDLLNNMGDAALGTVTAHIYSAAHPSAMNKEFVAAYKKAFNSRPGFMAVSGYDGIHLIYEALKKTGGKTDGDALIEAMKGLKWESPRGPISIDPETRDIVQNVYIRKVEKVDGELYNVEFQTFDAVKDSGKTKK